MTVEQVLGENTPEQVIAGWVQRYGHGGRLVLVDRLRALPLEEEQLAAVLQILNTTCLACFDRDLTLQGRCWCMADD